MPHSLFRRLIFAAALLLAGCGTPITVDRVDQRVIQRDFSVSALTEDALSQGTRNILRRWDLLDAYDRDAAGAIAALHGIVVRQRSGSGEAFALAEMSYLHGRKTGDRAHFLASAVYAYAYLFPGSASEAPDPYDPRFRWACDLYNLALASGLRSADGLHVDLRSGTHALPFGTLEIAFDDASRDWNQRQLANFVPANELQVRGLRNLYRRPGLGAPLAAATVSTVEERGFQVAPRIRVPTTALLTMADPRRQIASGAMRGALKLYTIFDAESVTVAGQTVPLEHDRSTVLALALVESGIWATELRGFLSNALFDTRATQLISLEPHRVGRIPVVMVHGTASSAARWADMVNDLLADPRIRERFEFWFFTYATGNPIPYSALLLREALQDAVDKLGGPAADPALGQMVVIGHSQGGLLAKMLVIDPGMGLWDSFFRRRAAEMTVSSEARDLLVRAFLIKPMAVVRRVVFIATPIRGSYVADFSIARWIGRLVTLPLSVAKVGAEILTGNSELLAIDPSGLRLGSVSGMSPGSPLIRALQDQPIASGVRVNTIIAVQGNGPIETSSDGVVEYRSAHVPGAESEAIVRSGHSTQSEPGTIEEVRRLLLLQLAEACRAGVGCPAAVAGR